MLHNGIDDGMEAVVDAETKTMDYASLTVEELLLKVYADHPNDRLLQELARRLENALDQLDC